MSDESANYGLIWIRRLTNVLVYGYFIVEAMPVLMGSLEHYVLLRKLLGLVLMLMLVVLILQNKAEVAALIRGRQTGTLARQFRRRVAEVWHLVAIVYTVAIYAVWVLEVPGGFEYVLRATVLSGVIAALVHTAVIVARRLLGRAFSLSVGLGKSHLAIAMGLAACQQQHSVLFASAIDAVNSLTAAHATGRLKQELRGGPRCLDRDPREIGGIF